MYDIITFGSATRDAFFYSSDFKIIKNKNFLTGKALALDLGAKIEIDDVVFATGGGGTNTASSFSNLGFKTACVVQVGDDISGKHILEELKQDKIDTSFINTDKKQKTAYSVILSSKDKGRTILVYRGASSHIDPQKINWDKLKSKWFYIASMNGNFDLLDKIFKHAEKNKIKIAFNPGSKELENLKLKPLLKKTNIFILNQEEASSLTQINFEKTEDILHKLDNMAPGLAIMTRGDRGVMAVDDNRIYSAKTLGEKGIEKTGAGDAFGSGFTSGMILKNDISYAMQLGSANATSVIKKIGAKNGLLSKKDLKNFKKVKVNVI
jgi:ribokinase